MKCAIIGCGYVADFYMATAPNHPSLPIAGVYDWDPARLDAFSAFHAVPAYNSLDRLLADPDVTLVLNLTTPQSHFEVTKACLEAGKHVYTEKPLTMDMASARSLVALAEARGLTLSGAPCGILGGAAQKVWSTIAKGGIGTPKLVYAEVDDGMVFRKDLRNWRSASGAPWPYDNEFEVGCTLEHQGYALTWLIAMFGPVEQMTSFSDCLFPDKGTDLPPERMGRDISIACLKFASGVVARVTCSIVARPDRSMRIIGEDATLIVENTWDYASPVHLTKVDHYHPEFLWRARRKLIDKAEDALHTVLPGAAWQGRRLPVRRDHGWHGPGGGKMDFFRGPAAQAQAIQMGQQPYIDARFLLHVLEVVLASDGAGPAGETRVMETDFVPNMDMAPVPLRP